MLESYSALLKQVVIIIHKLDKNYFAHHSRLSSGRNGGICYYVGLITHFSYRNGFHKQFLVIMLLFVIK